MSIDPSLVSDSVDAEPEVTNAPDGETKQKQDLVSRQELEKAAKKRDEFKKKAELAESKAQALENSLAELSSKVSQFEELQRTLDEQNAAKQGNVEQLTKNLAELRTSHAKQLEDIKAAMQKRIDDEAAAKKALENKLHKSFVEKGLLEALAAHSTNPAAMKVQLQAMYEFEPVEDADGNFTGVQAKGSFETIQELHDSLCDKLNLPFKKSQRQGGTGTTPTKPASSTSKGGIPGNFDTLSKEEKRRWMAENPELALSMVNQIGPTIGR